MGDQRQVAYVGKKRTQSFTHWRSIAYLIRGNLGQGTDIGRNRDSWADKGSPGLLGYTIDPAMSGDLDAYVAKFDPSASGGASLIYASWLGGADLEQGKAIAVDASGNAYVAGGTNSRKNHVASAQAVLTFANLRMAKRVAA